MQKIIYKSEGFFCKSCGRLGHTLLNCSHSKKDVSTNNSLAPPPVSPKQNFSSVPTVEGTHEWQTVSFPKKGISRSSMKKPDLFRPNTAREWPRYQCKNFLYVIW